MGYVYKDEILSNFSDPSEVSWIKIIFFMAFTILAAFITLPVGIISKILAGWLFGFTFGSIIGHLTLVFGSCLAFSFARYIGKEHVERKYYSQLASLNYYVSNHEFLTVLRLRLFPFIPLQISNFVLGVTQINTKIFFLGSFIGMLPATLFYSYIGSQIKGITNFSISPNQLIPFYAFLLTVLLLSFIFDHFSNIKHKAQIVPHLVNVLKNGRPHFWDEQAIPSYLHSNFFVRMTFWKRITSAIKIAPHGEIALDFGCGAGAMLPWLVNGYKKVYNFDISESALAMNREICDLNKWSNVHVVEMHHGKLSLADHSVDSIFALDVLEHVDNLPALLGEFKRIMRPDGRLIDSSPTENAIYKFMRKFGGPGYQGEFHLRAAKEVEHDLRNLFIVNLRKRIFSLISFFRIVEARNR